MPVQYTGIIDEHMAVRKEAGLFDISHMARLTFAGKDVLPLIQKVFTNDAAKMKDFQVRYGLVCNEAGGILDDILVYRWPYGWSMVVNASNREKIVDWLKQQTGSLDVTIQDRTFDTAMLAIQGLKALSLCEGLFEGDPSKLKYYYAMPSKYRGKECVVSRTGYTGEDGLEVIVANDQAVELADELVARGALPCGLGARDTLRLEAAMPLYGHELNDTTSPLEAGLSWAVKFDKGDFVGRSALQDALAQAPSKTIRVGIELEGKRAAREGSKIVNEQGETLGSVTSGSYVPHLQKSIAMGYVPPSLSKVGTPLLIDIRGTSTPAHVVALPFYKKPA
jgi:aminomethyltransferase